VPPLPPKATPETIANTEERRAQRVFYCLLIAFASPRSGELNRMTWEMVDLRRNTLRVPKGKTVSREMAIASELRPWLEVFGERAGWAGPVVQPWGSVRRDLANACTRAGVPKVTPNDLRRTFASWLVQAGESLFVVATLLGHNSTGMVEKVYGRLDAATLARAISKLPGGVPTNGQETTDSSRSTPSADCHADRANRWHSWHAGRCDFRRRFA
jgi:integrase